MPYSDKVLDHYNNPRNVGSFDKNASDIGTGIVGAPECGDVMKLQLKIEDGIIKDARFKTFGCLTSNMPICTPKGYIKISSLKVGDEVWAWNGEKIVSNIIEKIHLSYVEPCDLRVVHFKRNSGSIFKIICSKDHIFWSADNKPVEADELAPQMELYEITEYELRSLNNVGRQEFLKKKNSTRMVEFNKNFDHSTLPQNQIGYKFSEQKKLKNKISSIEMWKNPIYVENWKTGMSKIDWTQPTSIEQKFIELFQMNNVGAKYSAGKIWLNTNLGPASPDFIVPGKNKLIEVYTKHMPKHMQDRSEHSNYIKERTEQFQSIGYETLFLAIEDWDTALEKVNNFIHNGIKVESVTKIYKNVTRGCETEDGKFVMYDLKLKEGANIYFCSRVGNHNCGSAIASSSLATEMVKGKTLDEAMEIKNSSIVEELALPPVKIHCSVLAEDAIKAAIIDYRNKNG